MGEGHQRYLKATESSMEVVKGQYAVVDCQEAKEPGGTDQQEEQKGAAQGPAVRTWEDTGGHARVKQGLCRGHRRGQTGYIKKTLHTRTWKSQEDTEPGEHSGNPERLWERQWSQGATRQQERGRHVTGGKVKHSDHGGVLGHPRDWETTE